jgi:gas vesicle protein
MGQDPDQIRQRIEQTREEMGETIDALGYKADVPARAKDKVTGTVERAKEAISGSVDSVKEAVTGTASSAKDATPDSQQISAQAHKAVGVAQENPLGLAIGSVAAGFLFGMLLPATRLEDERLGPVADQVKEHATEVGHEALAHGAQVATQAAQAATETAKHVGQEHAQELQTSVQQHVEETRIHTPPDPT